MEWLDYIPSGPGYRLRKLRYEALPGLWIPALLYEPEKLQGKAPSCRKRRDGHYSVRETISGEAAPLRILTGPAGSCGASNIRMGRKEWVNCAPHEFPPRADESIGSVRCERPRRVLFERAAEASTSLLSLEHVDAGKLAVASGLSGGGWQTIVHRRPGQTNHAFEPCGRLLEAITRRVYHAKRFGRLWAKTPTGPGRLWRITRT